MFHSKWQLAHSFLFSLCEDLEALLQFCWEMGFFPFFLQETTVVLKEQKFLSLLLGCLKYLKPSGRAALQLMFYHRLLFSISCCTLVHHKHVKPSLAVAISLGFAGRVEFLQIL